MQNSVNRVGFLYLHDQITETSDDPYSQKEEL